MARKPLMAGNWKMNLNHVDAVGLVQKLTWTLEDKKHDPEKSEVVVFPPFTDLRTVQTLVEGDKLKIAYGAQDLSAHEDGAYTGDVSAAMLTKLKCSYVLVGHSERREYHAEDDTVINAKTKQALKHGLVPIVCVGEKQETREAEEHVRYTTEQIAAGLQGLSAEQVSGLVIAYEPVWAIGTGKTATAEDAQQMCLAIRGKLAELYGAEAAEAVRILYGGSVKAANVAQIMAGEDVDGCLVGGASLQVDEFAAIARYYDLPVIDL